MTTPVSVIQFAMSDMLLRKGKGGQVVSDEYFEIWWQVQVEKELYPYED